MKKKRDKAKKMPTRGTIRRALPVGSTGRLSKDVHVALTPGLRDRLFKEMDAARIPLEGRVQYLCSMTGRKGQSVRRWVKPDKPGLPDLESFAMICVAFDADANWMLGLTQTRYALPGHTSSAPASSSTEATGWLRKLAEQVADEAKECETIYMSGDEMEPRIKRGAPLMVDTRTKHITGNGTYLLEYKGQIVVRNVDLRIGEGLVLSCENTKYKETLVKDIASAKRSALKVLGRVRLGIVIQQF